MKKKPAPFEGTALHAAAQPDRQRRAEALIYRLTREPRVVPLTVAAFPHRFLCPGVWATPQGSGDSEAHARSASESDSSSESESEVPVWIPIFGEELSGVQFSSVEEPAFSRGTTFIMTQPNRHALVRLVGMQAPVELRTPDISPPRISEEIIEEYRTEQLAKWPFVLPYEEAVGARLEVRLKTLALPNTPGS